MVGSFGVGEAVVGVAVVAAAVVVVDWFFYDEHYV